MSARAPGPRQCGRCRLIFSGDVDVEAAEAAEAGARWWLCPPCRTAFLGDDHGRQQASRWD
jgi:hypothetical protein